MFINLRQLALSLAGAVIAGLGSPALAQDQGSFSSLGTLSGSFSSGVTPGTGNFLTIDTPNNDEFTFSGFRLAVGNTGSESIWSNYTATVSPNSGNPLLAFTTASGLASGTYVVQYQVAYTGPTPPSIFTNYDLLVRDKTDVPFGEDDCYANSSCTAESYLYSADPGFSDPFTPPTGNQVGSVVDGGSGTTSISKDGSGISPVWVRTIIDVSGSDTFTNFNNTFDAQAVPWETDVLPLVGATVLFGGAVWLKRRRSQKNTDISDQ